MTEHPIIFNAAMVCAILARHKTQTRRVVKPQLPEGADTLRDIPGENRWYAAYVTENEYGVEYRPLGSDQQHDWKCPYGKPGDRLWVREAWSPIHDTAVYYRADNGRQDWPPGFAHQVELSAWWEKFQPPVRQRWVPSIHMPRWASRITLEVLDVRVEEVQEITWDDAVAEGIDDPTNDAVDQFKALWDSVNMKRGFPWEANPHVWVITFKRIEP